MRLKIPITGTVLDYDPQLAALDGAGIAGDPNDPVRVVNLDFGNVSWHLVSIDLENDLMEVEAEASESVDIPVLDTKGKPVLNDDGTPKFSSKLLTLVEKQQVLDNAQHILDSHTVDEIYSMTGDKRLVKPASVMAKYRQKTGG